MKPTKSPAKERKMKQEKRKKSRGEERKQKVKVKTAVSLLNPKISKFCFLTHAFSSEHLSGAAGRELHDL